VAVSPMNHRWQEVLVAVVARVAGAGRPVPQASSSTRAGTTGTPVCEWDPWMSAVPPS
jgi:hypothetical protein